MINKEYLDYLVEKYQISRGQNQHDYDILVKEISKLPSNSNYVELGIADGYSLLIASLCRPDINCFGIEIKPDSKLERIIQDTGIKNITLFLNTKAEEKCKIWDKDIDFLFIDTAHWFPNIFWDFVGWLPYVKQGGIIIFDDYSNDIRMNIKEACQVFIGHPKYNLYLPVEEGISSKLAVIRKP